MKKIGLMGCGIVADYGHIPVLKSTDGLELHAVFEPNPERLRQMQEKHGIALGFTDEKAFFESGIDAVSITSPAPCHLANIRSACKYGKPILCEKPLGMSEDECREIIDMAKKANVMLFTGFDYRFSPAALKIRELIREGAIGELKSLRLIYIWNCHGKGSFDENGQWVENERRKGRMLEGGPMVDCGVHQIDLARFWTGSEVVASGSMGGRIRSSRSHVSSHGPCQRRPYDGGNQLFVLPHMSTARESFHV